MDSADEKNLLLGLHQEVVAKAVQVNTLRRELAEARDQAQEAVIRGAEMEAPLKALNEFTDHLLERTRLERDARSEPSDWGRSGLGNAVALTLYSDLCAQLDRIRTGYGL